MDTNRFIKTNGIVISSEKFKETSRIISVFTEKNGKIEIMAQSALLPKSGLLAATDFLALSNFLITPGKSFYYIKEANLIDSNIDLTKDITSFFIANYMAELVEKTQAIEVKDSKIYGLILRAFNSLKSEKGNKMLIKIAFSLKYISFLGYRPNISNDDGEKNYEQEFFRLDKNEIDLLNFLLYHKFFEIECINFQNNDIINKLDDIVYRYIIYCTEIKELKSQQTMKKLL